MCERERPLTIKIPPGLHTPRLAANPWPEIGSEGSLFQSAASTSMPCVIPAWTDSWCSAWKVRDSQDSSVLSGPQIGLSKLWGAWAHYPAAVWLLLHKDQTGRVRHVSEERSGQGRVNTVQVSSSRECKTAARLQCFQHCGMIVSPVSLLTNTHRSLPPLTWINR